MNILLIDDELDILEGMLDGVDFERLGFENVYTAQSAAQAKRLLESRSIDIMVTDIEMPGESGLDLLCWVRDRRLETVTLFCTSFAEFDYAQKAVELHSFDYFLKPISYAALEERLKAAVEEVERNRGLQHYSAHWEEVQRENKRVFWQNLVLRTAIPPDQKQAVESSVEYGSEELFVLCLFSLADGAETVPVWKKYAMRNVLEELLLQAAATQEACLPLEDGDWCYVFRQNGGAAEEETRRICTELSRVVQQHLSAWLNCFFAADVSLPQVRNTFLELEDALSDDVCDHGAVYARGEYRKQQFPYSLPQIKDWELLLTARQTDLLVSKIHSHLDRLAAGRQVNMPYIKAMRIDMMQMIHTVLKERQINAYDLFSDQRFDTLREESLRSLEHMKRYLEYIVRTAADYLGFTHESQSVIGRMKEYINSHYGEEITRVTMAKIVFLNPDYLARLFKKETGQSLGAYVQERRIYEAKKLLTETNVQVNEIALKVGYDNFSYFSHIFRERTGLTPNEYRKRAAADPT